MPDNFLVIRIHPDSPVDGATFSTYLEGLQIKIYLAGTYPGTPTTPPVLLGETSINSSSLNLVEVPWMPGTYVASVSKQVAAPTQGSGTNFGTTLTVDHTDGIALGSVATCWADSKMFQNNTTVTNILASSDPTKPTALAQREQFSHREFGHSDGVAVGWR